MWIIALIISAIIVIVSAFYLIHVCHGDNRRIASIVHNTSQKLSHLRKHKRELIKRTHTSVAKQRKQAKKNDGCFVDYQPYGNDIFDTDSKINDAKTTLNRAKSFSRFDSFVTDGRVVAPTILLVIFLLWGIGASWSGYRDYQIIPQQKVTMQYKAENITHYKLSMKYNRNDEKAERKGNAKFTGNLGKPKDNTIWQENYHKYFLAKGWHHFYKVAIRYEKHPLKHLSDYFYISRTKRTGNPNDLK